jgi:copper chaperone NosL
VYRWIVPVLLMIVGAPGCGRRDGGPEPLPIDRVNCARCGMLISSLSNAAEAISTGNDPRYYDDIGCLAGDAAHVDPETRLWVQRADGEGWIEARSAWFAESKSRTPMGHGVLAYASEGAANHGDIGGRARRWDDVIMRIAGHP